MVASYEPPPSCLGEGERAADNRRLVLADIVDAVIGCAPNNWPLDRLQVFGERVWKAILAKQYGPRWVKPDVALKAAAEVYADMTAYDGRPSMMPERQLAPPADAPLLGDEPDFMGKYPRLKAQVDALSDTSPCKAPLVGMLREAVRRHQARFAMEAG